MKLLIVFVSTLVLVAHGKAAPSNEEVTVKEIPLEEPTDSAVAGQEAGAVGGPQRIFGEEAPVRYGPLVVSAGGQRALEEPQAVERNVNIPNSIYVPTFKRTCADSECLYICNLLGFQYGICVSNTICQCYNN